MPFIKNITLHYGPIYNDIYFTKMCAIYGSQKKKKFYAREPFLYKYNIKTRFKQDMVFSVKLHLGLRGTLKKKLQKF